MKTDDLKPANPSNGTQLAIIGIGCLFPKAADKNAYWANIVDGVDAITEVPPTHWPLDAYYDEDQKSPDRTYGRRGGFLSPVDFNPMEFNIPPNVLEAIDTSQLLGLVAAGQALKDAGYGPERAFDKSNVSVILGVTGTLELVIPLGARLGHPVWRSALKDAGVDEETAKDVVERISDSYVPWQENSFPGLLGNVVAGRISKQYDLGGTNCVVDAACASSFSALHLASMELMSGKSDLVVSGGIDTFNDIFMYMCFSKTPALSPTGNAKPFDVSADGTILGEGLGIVVLKRLADAERDGDRIYAVIRGIGSSSDGKGDAIYAPSAAGQKKALVNAYRNAGVTPESIGMLEAHGTGTKVGDAVEVSALREVYGKAENPWCALGSVKSQIGHTKAAAGSAGLIKAALSLHHKVIPPTIKVQTPQKEVVADNSPFYLPTGKRPWFPRPGAPRRAAVSAFGFGGSNFHVVLEEYQPKKQGVDWDGNTQIFTFSGADAASLATRLDAVPADAAWAALRDLALASRSSFDGKAPLRLALVVERGKTNLASLVKNARAMLDKNAKSAWQTPDGAYFACGAAPGKLGMLFPGQGSQYTGMLNDLACSFPQVFDAVAAANEGFVTADGRTLSDLIYPPSSFDDATRAKQEEELRATQAAQPAIGATSLGALRVLRNFGVEPDAVAGHSYGELTALCAAGRLDESALHELSRLRGTLMGAGAGDKGSMLAVSAPLDRIAEVVTTEKLDLVIANKNAPAQAVLSGTSAEIKRAVTVFKGLGLTCKELPVAAAFHSALVADAAKPFLAALEKIDMPQAKIPVYANTTAAVYPADAAAAKAQLAAQLAKPVEFVAQIEAMYAAGITTFVEVGPGSRLTGLVQAILGNRPHLAFAVDASSGKRAGVADLARTVAQLAVLGYGVNLPLWDEGHRPAPAPTGKRPALTIPLCGANYVKAKPKKPPVQPKPAVIAAVQPSAAPAAAPVAPVQAAAAVPPQAAYQHPAPAAPGYQPQPAAQPAAHAGLNESLRLAREGMAVLQKMQEDTALLHRRFLEGQEAAAKTFQALLEQQQQLIMGAPAAPVARQSVPAAVAAAPVAPAPVHAATVPVAPPAPAVAPAPVKAAPAPVASAPAAPAVPAPPAAKGPDAGHITQTLLTVISEKTGYPIEMLELDMGMDSDLGIDSIKRVEILSTLQERLPGSPVIGPEHLGTLRTLGDIAGHLAAGAASAASPESAVTSEGTGSAGACPPSNSPSHVTETLLAVVSEKTGYPVEMLELEMGMDSDLGIDSIKRVEILSTLQERLPGSPAIGPEHLGTLRTLGDIAGHLAAGTVSVAAVAPVAAVAAPTAGAGAAQVTETLLAVVSEKTGYPVEMLELEMGMDSDLGIDSIKRVEILSTLQERLPGSPAIGPEHLGTLRTLGDIAGHLAAGAAPSAAAPATISAASSSNAADVTATLLDVVSEKTGYPTEMLELGMGMDSDLGIDSIKRVEILSTLQERLPGSPTIGPEHLGTLRTLGDIAGYLGSGSGSTPAPAVTAVAAPAAPAAPVASPAATALDHAAVSQALLEVVSDKTGYPAEMLEMTMGMDSDLGIDSIKRVEILSALQERLPASPAIGPEHLGTLRTLGDIANFLAAPAQAAAPAAAEVAPPAVTEAAPTVAAAAFPAAAPAPSPAHPIQRSSVVPVLLQDHDDDAITLANDGEIWVTDDGSAFAAELCGILLEHGCSVRKIDAAQARQIAPAGKLSGLVICAPVAGTDDLFLENAFLLLKNAAAALGESGRAESAVCITVSRLDGAFGFGSGKTLKDPLSGALAGLTKTAAFEWSDVVCKAIDLGEFPHPAAAAGAVAIEMLRRGPVEVGLTPEGRFGLQTALLPSAPAPVDPVLAPGDVVVITGGGRGVTAVSALALAKEYHPFLVLLGRSPEPQDEPAWLAGVTDEAEIKRAIMQNATGKLHPREIEERYRSVVAARELRATLAAIAATGAEAIYRSVDIRDQSAMELLLGEVRRAHGAIRGVVHGAGVLADRLIVDKTPEQFEQVYSTKVHGLRALLHATRNDDLKFVALFSSSTGRFGRVGQVDYAVANEVLNKTAQAEARRRSGCRCVSINWGPWDGGMVTPALKKVFASEGIGVIGLAEGGEFLAREISATDAPVEIVAIAQLPDQAGAAAPATGKPQNLSEAFSLTLTVPEYPFLRSHVLDGKAVLPMAVIVEWLAHGALHGNPGFRFHGFNDLRICKGVVFEDNTPFTVNVMAGRAEKRESFWLVPVELSSPGVNGKTILHARAEIVLATKHPEGIRSIKEIPSTPYVPHDGVIYNNERLFHGPDLHGIEQVDGCSAKGIAASVKGAPAPGKWIRRPLRSSWLTDPLVLDSAFQMMILWSFERFGAGSLPCFAARYRQFQETFPREGVQVVIRVTSESKHGASADMEFLDRSSGKLVARLEGYECVIDPSLKQAFQRNKLRTVTVVGAA
ncbi:type I polyketide synthase [Geomonas subterranea]|uniref:SDR family NAD(P)-dependent oxidoreductase n=1 Tax=Geomonas subterranea TaxID=2847989 RepID=A0ABX8LMQ7_9BACT|nr:MULTISPECIES: type I polyketide synthase [Geomonas]QXE92020.1 SDR family NAD(P)-dependent oxidoreductase [Geomonas subterranea]QXM09887.1 SDR family NAD(P)-dependent oxidoreductase [Geomonas subterranea]